MNVRQQDFHIPEQYKEAAKKIAQEEVNKQAVIAGKNLLKDERRRLNIMILHKVMEHFKVKKPTLEKFFEDFDNDFQRVAEKYEYENDDDIIFAMNCELLKIGVDVDKWLEMKDKEK